jgi:hypothetical protein
MTQTNHRFLAQVLVASCLVSFCQAVQAQSAGPLEAICLMEPFVPDLRFEYDKDPFIVLSWPVHLGIDRFYEKNRSDDYMASVFVEPQWRPADGKGRFLMGTRQGLTFWKRLGVVVDVAGVVGNDGHGLVLGGGFALFERNAGLGLHYLGLIYRHALTTEGSRNDGSLDLLATYFFED